MDQSQWVYGIMRDTIEYLIGVEKFMDYVIKDMCQRDDQVFFCPCRDCQNLWRFWNIEEVRVQLIRCGFKERYTQWLWHEENFEVSINIRTSRAVLNSESDGENIETVDPIIDVWDDSDGENIQNLDNPECMEHNDNLDEMMNDVVVNFLDIPEVFENLCNNSNILLYHDCTKFTKISVIFKLYNLKAKNGWSDKKIIYLL
jgi:Transposase-associated domain